MDEELKTAFVGYRREFDKLTTFLKNSQESLETANKHLDTLDGTFAKAENALTEPGERHDKTLRLFKDFWEGFNSDEPTLMTHERALEEYMDALRRHRTRHTAMLDRLANGLRLGWAKND